MEATPWIPRSQGLRPESLTVDREGKKKLRVIVGTNTAWVDEVEEMKKEVVMLTKLLCELREARNMRKKAKREEEKLKAKAVQTRELDSLNGNGQMNEVSHIGGVIKFCETEKAEESKNAGRRMIKIGMRWVMLVFSIGLLEFFKRKHECL